jgi:hypothetical protein
MRQSQNNRIDPDTRMDLQRGPVDRYGQDGQRTTRKQTTPWPLYIGVGLIVVLVLIGVSAALSKPFRHQLALSIVRQPTPYTQLYFPNPGTLPSELKVDHKNTFDFTVVNDENGAYHYTYTVTIADSRSHSVVSVKAVTIANGSSVTYPVTVVPKDRKAKYLITVALSGVNQSIHFYGETS